MIDKTILVIPSWYSNYRNPVRGSFIKEQALALRDAGYKIVVAFCELVPIKSIFKVRPYKIVRECDSDLITFKLYAPSFGSFRRKTWFERYSKFYRKVFKKICSKYKIDLIHAHSFSPAAYVAAANKNLFNCPIVYTEHFSGVHLGLNDYFHRAYMYTISHVDSIIAVSNVLKESMIREGGNGNEISIVPNILNDNFRYSRQKNTLHSGIKIISVGGLVNNKGHDLTIKAFARTFKENDAVLTIVGQGKEERNLKNLCKELGIQDKVFFAGTKAREEVAKMMAESSFFVLSSKNETFGVAYIEAMACGLPVIGTKCGGFEEIFFDGCGEIVEVGDIDGLCNAMKKVSTNLNRYNKEYISSTIISRFSSSAFVEKIEMIYHKFI